MPVLCKIFIPFKNNLIAANESVFQLIRLYDSERKLFVFRVYKARLRQFTRMLNGPGCEESCSDHITTTDLVAGEKY